eukprot:217797-Pyramimonas_sp.AAC.1
MPNWVWWTHADGPIGGFGGALYWAAERCTGRVTMPNRVRGAHVGATTRGFGGAPYAATKR